MKYESGNTSSTKVDRYGTVTAVGVGKVNITVKFGESNKYYGDSANVTVNVNYVPTEIDMGMTFVLFVDQSDNLDVSLSPAEAGSLIYQSDDESIVKVDANGVITAVAQDRPMSLQYLMELKNMQLQTKPHWSLSIHWTFLQKFP